jgi:hypothetical protein
MRQAPQIPPVLDSSGSSVPHSAQRFGSDKFNPLTLT